MLQVRNCCRLLLIATLAVCRVPVAGQASSAVPSSGSARSNFDGPAELPRSHVNASMADTPAPGKIWQVRSSAELQSAIGRASCGDTISLEAGSEFVGKFTLPAKKCDDGHWIIIRSNAPNSALPGEGTRLTPCYAGVTSLPGRPALDCASTKKVIATLMAEKGGGPLNFDAGANHYRLGPGLEITRPEGTGINYVLIAKEDKDAAVDHIIIDRDWVHGTAQDETTRGINLSGFRYAAVIDSYFSDFHCIAGIGACIDAQAISGGSGNVPMDTWKIENNFLEGAAETILFGGAAGTTTPTDIEIRHNHFFKPLTWMQGQPGFIGGANHDASKCVRFNTPGFCPFIVKNLLEFKNAQRVLVEGNFMEHTWPGFTQHGAAVLFTAMSQGGKTGNPNATVADITFRYNKVSHAASGLVMGIVGVGNTTWSIPKFAGRVSIHDDIFDDLSPAFYNGDKTAVGLAFQISQCPTCAPLEDININHVTMLLQSPRRFLILGAPDGTPIRSVTFTNNIVSVPADAPVAGMGPKIPCGFHGRTAVERINSCISSLHFEGNLLVGARDSWPRGNASIKDDRSVKFADTKNGAATDYHLSTASPHRHAGTDGRDPGADVDAVENAIKGAT
jgi:hypothetical protein